MCFSISFGPSSGKSLWKMLSANACLETQCQENKRLRFSKESPHLFSLSKCLQRILTIALEGTLCGKLMQCMKELVRGFGSPFFSSPHDLQYLKLLTEPWKQNRRCCYSLYCLFFCLVLFLGNVEEVFKQPNWYFGFSLLLPYKQKRVQNGPEVIDYPCQPAADTPKAPTSSVDSVLTTHKCPVSSWRHLKWWVDRNICV